MDIFKFVIVAYLSIGTVLAMDPHHPEVREDFKESASDIVRTFQKPDSIQPQFSPPVFEYGKAAQPDLQKWRYFQQQQSDSKNMAKVKDHLDTNGLFKKAFHFRSQHIPTISTPAETNLQPRWKIIHPKFVSENQKDVSPGEAMNMDFSKRDSKKIVIIVPQRSIIRDDRRSNRKQDYNVKEAADLDVEASENYERVENHAAFLPPGITYKTGDQNDISALNSLLGQPPNAQLQGLQQLLHSQGTHVAPMPSQTDLSSLIKTNNHAGVQTLLQGGNVLAKPQDIGKLQAQLDALTQNHAQKALLEAQQYAEQHIKQQHEAIERAKIEAQKKAFAQIEAQNLAIAQPILQQQPQNPIESTNLVEESTQQHVSISDHNQAPRAQALTGTVDHNEAIEHAVLQAQTYLQLSTPNHQSFAPEHNNQYNSYASYAGGQQDNTQQTVPEATQHSPASEGQHLDHNYNQFSSYGSYGYTRGNNGVVSHQDQEDHIQHQPQVITKTPTAVVDEHKQEEATQVIHQEKHQEEQHEEYAPQYKFGYRIMDYHSGNDYGHEESREGKMTKGQYHALLPDGRMQNVVYWAGPSGYHAKVTYSNVAQH